MPTLHPVVEAVTARVRRHSRDAREAYLGRLDRAIADGPARPGLSCTNLAHAAAALPPSDKQALRTSAPNLAIVSAYNDLLSAHQPFGSYPEQIKAAARRVGATAQFAGGVPAMCDGVTQGQPGMELSLFSRDAIAMAAAIALSHNTFDAALFLGVCDKIVPGLVIGALAFGHLPAVFVPAGPMTSGLSNEAKAQARQRYALGEIDRDELLESEGRSYHGPGTCTFYGTANSNQMLMEVMGLHLPGAAFINPGTPLRKALTAAAAQRAAAITAGGAAFTPVGRMIDERSIINAVVALLATGGSTNHTIHLVAMARAAGILIDWNDFSELSDTVPLLARVYPNGAADVNRFHAAGGTAFVIRELLRGGLLHEDVQTIVGQGLGAYTQTAALSAGELVWRPLATASGDDSVLRPVAAPFDPSGGLKLLTGNLGRAIIKVSTVKPEHRTVRAPARVFDDQREVLEAFDRGELERDFIAVVRFQGPRANGMPELHKLTPALSILQGRGFRVGLLTDGRMSGASGKVPAAIHVSPEASQGGAIGLIRDGDTIVLDAVQGRLIAEVEDADWRTRTPPETDLSAGHYGLGRELFDGFRARSSGAEQGALSIMGHLAPGEAV